MPTPNDKPLSKDLNEVFLSYHARFVYNLLVSEKTLSEMHTPARVLPWAAYFVRYGNVQT